MQRHQHKQITPLAERLAKEAKECREQAKLLPPGGVRDALLAKARQADATAQLDECLMSPRSSNRPN